MKNEIKKMYENNINEMKNTIKANKKYNVLLKDSAWLNFDIENGLLNTVIIDKYQDQLSKNDLDNVDQLLKYPINDEILEDVDFLDIVNIKEQLIIAYIENKEYLIKESNKIKSDPIYGFFDEFCDQNWFIIFNIKNFEMDITDHDNIYRYGSIDDVLIFDIF